MSNDQEIKKLLAQCSLIQLDLDRHYKEIEEQEKSFNKRMNKIQDLVFQDLQTKVNL